MTRRFANAAAAPAIAGRNGVFEVLDDEEEVRGA